MERRFANSKETKDDSVIAAFLESLHVEDLAHAIGCRSGNDSAWREFDTIPCDGSVCELHKTFDALAPRDRLRLSYYYVQELTLAETGALLGEQSTVSRGLARIRAEIRRNVEGALRKDYRLSDASP